MEKEVLKMEKTTTEIKLANTGGNVMVAYAEKGNHLYLVSTEIGLNIYELSANDFFNDCEGDSLEKNLVFLSEENILYYSKKEQLTDLSVEDLKKVIEILLEMSEVKNLEVDSHLVKSMIAFYEEKTK